MRQSLILLTILQFLSFLVAAHPFIIVNTSTSTRTKAAYYHAYPTHILPKRQGSLFDQFESAVNSVLGIDTPTSTSSSKTTAKATSLGSAATPSAVSTRTAQTLAPPVVATTTSTSSTPRGPPSTSSSTAGPSSTSTDSSTSTLTTSSTTITSSSTSTTPTSTTDSTTSLQIPSTSLGLTQPTNTPLTTSSDDNGNKVPAVGIAVAVIMIFLIALCASWLIFRYNARAQAWWAARQEKKRQERSYREALDGPNAGSPNLRQEALAGDRSRRRTMLVSFFAPANAMLGGGKEIKRKPVNWGAKSSMVETSPVDGEKVPITASAAPMGRDSTTPTPTLSRTPTITSAPPVPRSSGRHIIAELDSTPIVPPSSHPVSPVTVGVDRNDSLRNLPPISPMSPPRRILPNISETQSLKSLHSIPGPRQPGQPPVLLAKKGTDGVYRLG